MRSPIPEALIRKVQRWFCRRQITTLAPFLSAKERVLDFGCGNCSLAAGLLAYIPGLQITGVDVVDANNRPPHVPFCSYVGSTLPFKDHSFDVVFAYHALHHCSNPEAALGECCRVARSRVLIVEPTVRSAFDLPAMRFTDWLFNAWKPEPVPLPYHFRQRDHWRCILSDHGFSIEKEWRVSVFPAWLPIGETVLFLASRSHEPATEATSPETLKGSNSRWGRSGRNVFDNQAGMASRDR